MSFLIWKIIAIWRERVNGELLLNSKNNFNQFNTSQPNVLCNNLETKCIIKYSIFSSRIATILLGTTETSNGCVAWTFSRLVKTSKYSPKQSIILRDVKRHSNSSKNQYRDTHPYKLKRILHDFFNGKKQHRRNDCLRVRTT